MYMSRTVSLIFYGLSLCYRQLLFIIGNYWFEPWLKYAAEIETIKVTGLKSYCLKVYR